MQEVRQTEERPGQPDRMILFAQNEWTDWMTVVKPSKRQNAALDESASSVRPLELLILRHFPRFCLRCTFPTSFARRRTLQAWHPTRPSLRRPSASVRPVGPQLVCSLAVRIASSVCPSVRGSVRDLSPRCLPCRIAFAFFFLSFRPSAESVKGLLIKTSFPPSDAALLVNLIARAAPSSLN